MQPLAAMAAGTGKIGARQIAFTKNRPRQFRFVEAPGHHPAAMKPGPGKACPGKIRPVEIGMAKHRAIQARPGEVGAA